MTFNVQLSFLKDVWCNIWLKRHSSFCSCQINEMFYCHVGQIYRNVDDTRQYKTYLIILQVNTKGKQCYFNKPSTLNNQIKLEVVSSIFNLEMYIYTTFVQSG